MRKAVIAAAVFLGFATFSFGQTGFNGTWVTNDFKAVNGTPAPTSLTFKVEGSKVTGMIGALPIVDAMVNGNTVTFKATNSGPFGDRINTYTGKLNGDAIAFTRSVKLSSDKAAGGPGIFGTLGAMQFTAKRDAGPMSAFYGSWRLNVEKSKYDPAPGPAKPMVPAIHQVTPIGDGAYRDLTVSVNANGVPGFTLTPSAKLDGKDYPAYVATDITKPIETISAKAIDPRTVEFTFKQNNAVVGTNRNTVSPDGKTVTVISKTMDSSGKQTASSTLVYERIP